MPSLAVAPGCASSESMTRSRLKAACRSFLGGKVVGAIGASGGSAQQDGQVAQAGAAALK